MAHERGGSRSFGSLDFIYHLAPKTIAIQNRVQGCRSLCSDLAQLQALEIVPVQYPSSTIQEDGGSERVDFTLVIIRHCYVCSQ